MNRVAAEQAIGSTYRWMKTPPEVGQLRVKSWSYLIPPIHDADPVWADRCKKYWELQQETYGLKHTNYVMFIDREQHIVTTASVIAEVLPGRRTRDYIAPRARPN